LEDVMVKSETVEFGEKVTASTIVGNEGVYLNVRREDETVWSTTVPFHKVNEAKMAQERAARRASRG
jgi:hypothetical protein